MSALRTAQRRQRGVAAIELALIMLFFMGLLPIVLLFGRALFAYTVMQKSAHEAARYLATVPLPQMSNIAAAIQHTTFARQMVLDAMVETWPGMDPSRISIDCLYVDDFYGCGTAVSKPLQVRIKIIGDIPVNFLPDLVRGWLGQGSTIPLRANATIRYDR